MTGVSENQGNQVLMERLYSPDFIRSGFTDIAEIQAPSRRYQIAHRGVQTCDGPFELISK